MSLAFPHGAQGKDIDKAQIKKDFDAWNAKTTAEFETSWAGILVAEGAGAVYVFSRTGSTWTQQTYVKASNTDAGDFFGSAVGLSSDGTLAVGARRESSNATGIGGNGNDNPQDRAGAVYLY